MADEKRLSLNAWVDKEKKRVVFAEADSDFVDALFSFLTLPLGTIIKLLSNNSGLGCIDNLYDSIKQLSDQHFSTKACKNMLLSPCSAAAEHCEKLKLNVSGPREFYSCKMDDCISRIRCYYSSVWQTRCYYCGKFMDEVVQWRNDGTTDGVFVKKDDTKFMITDDFRVTQSSVSECYDRLKELGLKDINPLEEWVLEFGREELLNLLKESLRTKEALTNICFRDSCIQYSSPQCNNWMEMIMNKSKGNAEFEIQEMLIRLIMNRTSNKVVRAEVGKEFADQLFSFLTFPLGSVLKLIGYSDSFGCMSNLYDSIHELEIKYFKSERAKSMLISPQLAPFFRYRKQMLYIEESSPLIPSSLSSCQKCYWDNNNSPCNTVSCKHGVQQSHFIEMDPMLAKADTYMDDGFVRSDQNFQVTDDLHVTPMSLLYFIQILRRQGLHVDHLEYEEMVIERDQVYNLLEAMLISKSALSDALSSRKWSNGIQCTKFFSSAGCRFGEGCHFLHYVPGGYNAVAQMSGNPAHAPASRNPVGLPPLSDGPPKPAAKTRLCNKFNTPEGCNFGEKCHFAHGERELGRSLLSGHEARIAPSIGGRLGGRFEPPPPPALGAAASFGASATAKISVDASLADAIIGKGGVNTKQVCRLTGAKLSIRDHESDTNLRNIELEGTFDQIKQATAMVRELIVNISSSAVPVQPGRGLGAAVGGGGGPGHGPGSNFKTKLCENFTKGTCTFGDRCHFAHAASELRKAAA